MSARTPILIPTTTGVGNGVGAPPRRLNAVLSAGVFRSACTGVELNDVPQFDPLDGNTADAKNRYNRIATDDISPLHKKTVANGSLMCFLMLAVVVGVGGGLLIGWNRPGWTYTKGQTLSLVREVAARNVSAAPTALPGNQVCSGTAEVNGTDPYQKVGAALLVSSADMTFTIGANTVTIRQIEWLNPVADHLIQKEMQNPLIKPPNVATTFNVIRYFNPLNVGVVNSDVLMRVDAAGQHNEIFYTIYSSDPAYAWLTSTPLFSSLNFDNWPIVTEKIYTYASNETRDDFMLFPVGSSVRVF